MMRPYGFCIWKKNNFTPCFQVNVCSENELNINGLILFFNKSYLTVILFDITFTI